MTHDPIDSANASREGRYVFGYLYRRGESVRLRPLMRHLRLEPRDLVAAITDLRALLDHHRLAQAAADTRPYTDIERLCTTRFGRKKYRTTWPPH